MEGLNLAFPDALGISFCRSKELLQTCFALLRQERQTWQASQDMQGLLSRHLVLRMQSNGKIAMRSRNGHTMM